MTFAAQNTQKVRKMIDDFLDGTPYKSVIGAANFRTVYTELIKAQQKKLRQICGRRFEILNYQGVILSIGVTYFDPIIDCIHKTKEGSIDIEQWNRYALEYERLNGLLDDLSIFIARKFRGIPIPATVRGLVNNVSNVSDYYHQTVSHRLIAEIAGLGWRGKNGLTINEHYSCALRFTSIITEGPFDIGSRIESRCGECTACEDACSFIRDRDILRDYRENCMRYISQLGLVHEVCGKCILACYRSSKFADQFNLSEPRD